MHSSVHIVEIVHTIVGETFANFHTVVWKFKDVSVIQILREINFEESGSSKSAFLVNFNLQKV